MLTREMLFHKQRVHSRVGIDRERYEGHLGNLLHHDGMIDSLVGIFSPGEGTVVLYQYARCMDRIDVVFLEFIDDDHAGIELISSVISSVQGMASWK